MRRWIAGAVFVMHLAGTACTTGDATGPAPSTAVPSVFQADRCLVRVHGRSETGADPRLNIGYAELSPTGNGTAGAGHQWLYATDADYRAARDRILDAVQAVGCQTTVLNGFSNGASFVGALLCRGEDLGGRLVGAVIDDPVPDEGTAACTPAPGVRAVVYWTGGLSDAKPGVTCDSLGWTCAGDTLVGIDAYASEIGVSVLPSPHTDHTWYRDAPELTRWLNLGAS